MSMFQTERERMEQLERENESLRRIVESLRAAPVAEQQPDALRCGGCGTEIDARCEDCRNAIRCEGCGQRIEDDEYDVWEDGVYTHKGDCPPSGENDAG